MKTFNLSPARLLRLSLPALALPVFVACGDTTGVDGGDPASDAGTDMVESDAGTDAGPEPETLQAMVYPTSPLAPLEQVTLSAPTTDDGSLTGQYVNAINCVNQPGGPSLGFGATLCKEEKTAFPDEDGNYTAIMPPDQESGEDPFAEVQMYHHVNVIHDYFKSTFDFSDLDFPLDAVVNLNINFGGSWQSFPNAAFMPPEAFAQFGLPPRDNGAIMFGQDAVDFSYDASVIYHEYTHAVVGPNRLSGVFLDIYGMNNALAVNEGLADYFASTVLADPALGIYALGLQHRDLSNNRKCPDDLTTEVHADGKIVGSALWEARETLGADLVDEIVFGALMSSGPGVALEGFGQLLVAEAEEVLNNAGASTFTDIMADHGMVGCDRARSWETLNLAQWEGVPHTVQGTGDLQGVVLPDGVPGYHGWKINLQEGQVATLSWQIQGSGFFGGEPSPLGMAVRKGQPVTLTGTGTFFADDLVDAPAVENDQQTMQIGGNCVPSGGGDIFLMFRNQGQAASNVVSIAIDVGTAFDANLAQATCD